MSVERLVVVGGRRDGHGKVVVETARETPGIHVVGVLEDAPSGPTVAGVPVLGRTSDWPRHAVSGALFVIAIGDNAVRKRLADAIVAGGGRLARVVHPRAWVAPSASVGAGTLVCAGALVGHDAHVGRNCIVNHGVILEHDTIVADHVNLSTGTVTGGRVTFDEGAFTGVGVRVIPDVAVGAWSVLGAGAVATRSTDPRCMYVGVPARRVRAL